MKKNTISTPNNRRPFIKVCGLTYAGTVDCAASYGADYVGFDFCPGSPRYVSPAHVAGMHSANVMRVGVFNGGDAAGICRTMQQAGLHLAQLQGRCTVEDARTIGPQRVIRALHPGQGMTAGQLQAELDRWAPFCRAFLVESDDAGLLSGVDFPRPWILSARMDACALQHVLLTCHPDGIDVESRVGCAETMAAMRAVS